MSPNSEYDYFPFITNPYYYEIILKSGSISVVAKIRSVNLYLIKLFREIVFFQNLPTDNQPYINIHILDLNFARRRFFPQLKNINDLNNEQETIFNNSLGITSKYLTLKNNILKFDAIYF